MTNVNRDNGVYEPNQTVHVALPSGEAPTQLPWDMKVGPSYFDSMKALPDNKYILGLPLAKNPKNSTISFTQEGIKRIGMDNIYAFELGNEPDHYGDSGQTQTRPKGWTAAEYVAQWTHWTTDISNAVGLDPEPAAKELPLIP